MLITIITICYNAEQFIERTLQCVANQSFQDYEYLIQDGGSSDGTLALVEKYRTEKFSVFSERDKGIYDALNKAVANAKGEYVCFLHAGDTFFSNDTLKNIFEYAIRPDFIYGDTVIRNQHTDATRSPINDCQKGEMPAIHCWKMENRQRPGLDYSNIEKLQLR